MIGLFNDNFPPVYDGVALTVKNYADWIANKGRQVSVVTPYTPGLAETPYPIFTYHSLPLLMRKPYRVGLPLTDYEFRKHLAEQQFSIIHAHCPFTSGFLAVRAARKQKIPLIATFHSKYRQDFERALRSKLLVNMAIKQVVSFYEKAYEVWIPQASVEPTLREYGYKGPVRVVSNGNDYNVSNEEYETLRRNSRQQLGLADNEIMLLFVGQQIKEKNIQFTIEALAHIKDLPFKFYSVGDGYAYNELKHKAAKLGLKDKIVMPGMVENRQELKKYYAASDLFLFPSPYDTFGIVVEEAAALRTPSILLQGSTASGIITDGQNGFLTIDNAKDYAYMIKWLMNNPDKLRSVGNNASKTLVRTWENVVEEVLNHYDEVCQRYKSENK